MPVLNVVVFTSVRVVVAIPSKSRWRPCEPRNNRPNERTMGPRFLLDVSMSLDGFIAQRNDEAGRLHDWIFTGTTERSATSPRDSASGSNRAVIDELFNTTGAVVMGRRTFDFGEELWGDEPPFQMPCFVVSHRFREEVVVK